ncbi:MAG: GtrA family protein [Bacteroidota bacterium]
MITFLKANISSLVASLSDYIITIIAVHFFYANVVIGGIIGTICGGVINFLIGRHWVFSSDPGKGHVQGLKYLLVWTGNLGLNATGMYVLTEAGNSYIIAKVATSLLVAIAYNYPLQKKYVFNTRER